MTRSEQWWNTQAARGLVRELRAAGATCVVSGQRRLFSSQMSAGDFAGFHNTWPTWERSKQTWTERDARAAAASLCVPWAAFEKAVAKVEAGDSARGVARAMAERTASQFSRATGMPPITTAY